MVVSNLSQIAQDKKSMENIKRGICPGVDGRCLNTKRKSRNLKAGITENWSKKKTINNTKRILQDLLLHFYLLSKDIAHILKKETVIIFGHKLTYFSSGQINKRKLAL